MKWIIAGAVLAGWPYWISTTWANPGNDEVQAEAQVIVVTGADCQGAACGVAVGSDDEKSATKCGVVVLARDDEDAGEEHRVRRVWKVAIPGKRDTKDRGWLGVSVGEVPESVAAHLESDAGGVMILNVVQDSPADRAGIEVHDIILAIADSAVEADVGRAAKLIGSHKPGEPIEIKVLRAGQEKALIVELGSWPDKESIDWKVHIAPLAEVEEEIKTRGKFMLRGQNGDWVFKDLGNLNDLEVLEGLPDNVRVFIPQSGSRSVQVFVNDGEKSITTRVERDGNILVVEQENDGEITVRRTDKNGRETVDTYASKDELRNADEEAYEAYKSADKVITLKIDIDGLEALEDIDVEFDLDEWKDQLGDWRAHLHEALDEANEARRRAMEHLEEAMKQWKGAGGSPTGLPFSAWPFALPDEGDDLEKFLGSGFVHIGKPRHSFELREDGKIEVRIRKGDSELVQLYTDEDDLAERNPKLHAKYRELMSAGE